jgi:pimeloyl-ACP methyl ester carboxylesterase
MKPMIHFAHANGIPSLCYQKLFDVLEAQYQLSYVPVLGTDPRYPVDDQWQMLTQQVIDSIAAQSPSRPVIAVGHSLGALLSYQAAQQRPDLIAQVVMLDPPLVMGMAGLALHLSKKISQRLSDHFTPAGVSSRRREHWDSRQQAAELLARRGFFKEFDRECFAAYIEHGLIPAASGQGVCLRIPKAVEVEIFRCMPSLWWRPRPTTTAMPVDLIVGQNSPFWLAKYPQQAKRKLAIDYHLSEGGHMFPLQYPQQTAQRIQALIESHAGARCRPN